jgi:hypothetical protein
MSNKGSEIETPCNNTSKPEIAPLPIEYATDEDCPICLLPYASAWVGHIPYVTHCGHTYHRSCILNWIRFSPTCPMCRTPVCKDTWWNWDTFLTQRPPPRSSSPMPYDGPEKLFTWVLRYHKPIDRLIRNGEFYLAWEQFDTDGKFLRRDVVKRFKVKGFTKCLVVDDHGNGPFEYTVRLERYA